MWNGRRHEYYIACVRRNGRYSARGKRVDQVGRLIEMCAAFEFDTQREAERRCRDMAALKCRKHRYVRLELDALPRPVQEHLEVPPDMQMTPWEMVEFLEMAPRERYVVLRDVRGMEEHFDAGVQYVGYETADGECVAVYDRFGVLRECFVERVASMEPTERAVEMAGRAG